MAVACLVLSLAGATHALQDGHDTQDRPTPTIQPIAPGGAVPKPANPNAMKGSWTIGDVKGSLTEGEFYRWHLLLNKLEGTAQQGVAQTRVWEFLLVAKEADALGIKVLDYEVDEAMQKDDVDLYNGYLQRLKNLGVTLEDARDYHRENRRADRLRDLHLNNTRLTTQKAFDLYKIGKQKYKLEYVQFAIEDVAAAFRRDTIDELTLKTFWSENKIVQNQFRTPNSISAELVYLDAGALSVEDAAKIAGGREITRQTALEYFARNRDTLMRQVPPDKQHLLHIDADTPLDKVVSPFSLLEDTIRKQLLLEEVLKRAHELALAGGVDADLAKTAADYRLGYEKVADMEKAHSIGQLQRFGFNIFTTLTNANEKEVSPQLFDEQGVRYFFRVNKRVASRLPEYEEVRDRLMEAYIETKSLERVRKTSQEAITWLNSKLTEQIQPLQDRLNAQADADAEKRIAEQGMTKDEDKNRERMRARSVIRQPLDDERKKLRPQIFDQMVKERGLTTKMTGYFEAQPQRFDPNQATPSADVESGRMKFLQTNYYIQSLSIGDVTPIVLEDPITKSFFICKLADKKDPELSSMSAVDMAQARAQLKIREDTMFMLRWRYAEVAKRCQLQVGP